MESFARVFPLDWTTVEYVSAVVGVLIVVLCLLAFLLRRSRHRHERHSRAAAEQLAALTAGEMMARSQEDGDRFSLKEGNSIATLITDAVLALKQVSITFPKGISQAEATKRAGDFATAMKHAQGCGAVDAVAQQQGAQVVANDQVRARDLPGPLQEAILKLSIGETSPPFGSIDEGVRVLMLCGRDDPQTAQGPNFDQLQAQMEDDRVNKRAQIYLRDLRRDAVIDYN